MGWRPNWAEIEIDARERERVRIRGERERRDGWQGSRDGRRRGGTANGGGCDRGTRDSSGWKKNDVCKVTRVFRLMGFKWPVPTATTIGNKNYSSERRSRR